MVDNKTLGRFISGINRGPLKNCKYLIDPRDEEDDKAIDFENKILINNKVYRMVVDQAYLDMCRTMTNVDPDEKNDMLEVATRQLVNYFENNETIEESYFDDWHEKTVDKVTEEYENLTIGQTQKIINMSFKYLYCFRYFRKNKKEFFDYCHMPLDSITLDWYRKQISNKVSMSWSKLDKKEDYCKIINEIRKKTPNKTMLEQDFEVWGNQKEEDALNELRK